MIGYEIKSDVDSLERLPRQIRAFNNVFDRAFAVITKRHVATVERIIPQWWGIILPNIDDEIESFQILRDSGNNPNTNIEATLYMLRKAEIVSILKDHESARGVHDKNHTCIVGMAASRIAEDALKYSIRQVLRRRLKNQAPALSY
jgi:hypothetical protein